MSDPNEVVPVKQVVSFMTSIFFSCYNSIISDLSAGSSICCDGWLGRRQDCKLAGKEQQLEECGRWCPLVPARANGEMR
jgi:hypothetical protein